MRFRYLIDKRMQFAVIGYVNGACLAMLGLFYLAGQRAFRVLEAMLPRVAEGGNVESVLTFVRAQEDTFRATLMFGGVLALVVTTFAGLVLSHRIAGPLYAIRRHFQDLADGTAIHPIKLRKGDYFTDLAEAANRFFERLGAKQKKAS